MYGEQAVLEKYLELLDEQTAINKKIKNALDELDKKVLEKYSSVQKHGRASLSEEEIKQLVVEDKWITVLERNVKTEMERISQRLAQRIKELAERYETPLPQQTSDVADLESKVNTHL